MSNRKHARRFNIGAKKDETENICCYLLHFPVFNNQILVKSFAFWKLKPIEIREKNDLI